MRQTWQELLVSAYEDGSALSNSAAATSILPASAKLAIPANFMDLGRVLRVTAAGRLSNIVTTPGTLTMELRFGSTVVFSGAAMQLSTTAHTNLPWWFQALLTCRTGGATANLMGQAVMQSQCLSLTAVADSATTPAGLLVPNTAPAVGNNFDATASNTIDFYAAFSIANAGNAMQLHQFVVESLN